MLMKFHHVSIVLEELTIKKQLYTCKSLKKIWLQNGHTELETPDLVIILPVIQNAIACF